MKSKLTQLLLLIILVLGITYCVQSTNPVYGNNYGSYIDRIYGRHWEINIVGLENERTILNVFFKPNQKVKYTVMNGSNKGYICDDGKDRWRVCNDRLYISFNDELINLRGILHSAGFMVWGLTESTLGWGGISEEYIGGHGYPSRRDFERKSVNEKCFDWVSKYRERLSKDGLKTEEEKRDFLNQVITRRYNSET